VSRGTVVLDLLVAPGPYTTRSLAFARLRFASDALGTNPKCAAFVLKHHARAFAFERRNSPRPRSHLLLVAIARSALPSTRPALLDFVQLDRKWRLDRAAANGWFRWGAGVSTCAPAHRPKQASPTPERRRSLLAQNEHLIAVADRPAVRETGNCAVSGAGPTRGTLIQLDFEEIDGITTVSFAHSGLWDEEAVRSHEDGWGKVFDNLERTLERLAQSDSRSCDLQSRR
jgi:hypothetical protein